MKKTLYILLSCTLLVSCQLETSNNGALDGNWQLRQIDTLSTGGVCDMTYSYIYWGIENDLLQVRDIDNSMKILFRFDKQEDLLTIYSPYHVVTKDLLEPLENAELLTPFGIAGTQDTFQIEQLNHNTLTIRNQYYRMHFRRY